MNREITRESLLDFGMCLINKFGTGHQEFKKLLVNQAKKWFEGEFAASDSGKGGEKGVSDGYCNCHNPNGCRELTNCRLPHSYKRV